MFGECSRQGGSGPQRLDRSAENLVLEQLEECCCRGQDHLKSQSTASARVASRMLRIHTFIATSDVHLEYKLRMSRQQVLEETVGAGELARSLVDDVEWSAEGAIRTDPVYLEEICKAAVGAGATTTINIPDTVGYSFPYEIKSVLQQLYSCSQLLAGLISFGPQPNKAIVGANAFAHEAGIHQDGFLKERTTYEIVEPLSAGVPESKVILGKHSGRHALSRRCSDLGCVLNPSQLEDFYQRFIDLADDQKRGVADTKVETLIREVMIPEASGI